MIKNKLFVGLTLFIFFVVTTSIFTAGLISKNKEDKLTPTSSDVRKTLGLTAGDNSGNSEENASSTITLTQEFVAKHNSSSDCYIIIDNFVYNVSSFLSSHPGGSEQIIPYCGRDASQAFATKDKNPSGKHSPLANNMLKDYVVGKLGDNITLTTPVGSKSSNTPTSVKTPTGKVLPITFPTSVPQTPLVNNTTTLTVDEIAKHNTQVDCWMIISGNVYNLTSYISRHPGGLIMVPFCGRDGTKAFQTKGGQGGLHSSNANNLLAGFLLGRLDSTIGTQSPPGQNGQIPPGTTNSTPIPNPTLVSTNNIPAAILIKYPGAIYINGKYEDGGEWEGKINVSGSCRSIKISETGIVTEDKKC